MEVSRIGLGCVTFGREIDEQASFDILDRALDAGINFLDTAEAYGGGQARKYRREQLGVDDVREASAEMHSSELILGRWLARRRGDRHRVIVQSKMLPPLTPQRIAQSIDASLERLQVDVIDFYLAHAFDPTTPLEQTLEGLSQAQRAGKIRFTGCSNFSAVQLRQALDASAATGGARLDVIQSNYNLAVRDIEKDLLPLCRRQGVGVQTYSPLGAGFLTGKYRAGTDASHLPQGTRFHVAPGHMDIYFHPEKFEVVERLRGLSQRTGEPMTKLAMAWVLANDSVDTMLIGARTPDHVRAALEAAELKVQPDWFESLDRQPP